MVRIAAIICLLASSLFAQIKANDPILSPVPPAARDAYREAFALYVDTQVQGDWKKMYSLSSPVLRQNQPEADFVQQMQGAPRLKKFSPTRFESNFQNEVVFTGHMYGCASYEYGGKAEEWFSLLPSSYARGNWYFAPIHPFVHPGSKRPLRCDEEYPRDKTREAVPGL